MEKTGFFQNKPGNNSNSRLIGFVIVMFALFYTGVIIYFGRQNVLQAAGAASGFFVAVTTSTLVFLYKQKRTEEGKE